MTELTVFREQLTKNHWGLEKLFLESEALSEIQHLSKDAIFMKKPFQTTPYFGYRRIVWICLTHPICSLMSTFCCILALLFTLFGSTKHARIFTVLSHQWVRDWQQVCHHWDFESSPLLIPSFDVHKSFSWDVYKMDLDYRSICDETIKSLTFQNSAIEKGCKQALQIFYDIIRTNRPLLPSKTKKWKDYFTSSPISEEPAIGNPIITNKFISLYKAKGLETAIRFLKEKFSKDSLEQPLEAFYFQIKKLEQETQKIQTISLYSPEGVCRGASLWFIYLFLKTKNFFPDPKKNLLAVSQQFITGMPKQATILQAFDRVEAFLKLRKYNQESQNISLYELDAHAESARTKMHSLPQGIFRVGCYRHSLVYIKLSEGEQYVWDPRCGLMPTSADQLLKMIKKYYYKPGDPSSHISFDLYENRLYS